jgi:hemerythrin-like metal-binding protein
MVEPFSWSDAFTVGEQGLDAEHRRTVELINEICIRAEAGWRESIDSLLRELQFVSEMHFRNEETVLARIAAKIDQKHLQTVVRLAIEQHAREHRRQLDKLQDMVMRTDDHEICESLKSWFVDHVVREDAQVKTILQSTSHMLEASRDE